MLNDSISNPLLRQSVQNESKVTFPTRSATIAVLGILMALTGCASAGKTSSSTNSGDQTQLLRADMMADLMSVLPQVMEPLTTTVQISDTESGQSASAANELVKLGYGLQRVDADQGSHFLYVTDLLGSDNAKSTNVRLRVSIGDLELTRSYDTIRRNSKTNISDATNLVWRENKAVVPTGALTIAGTRQAIQLSGINVELESRGSNGQTYEFTSGKIQYAALAPIEGGIPTISLITDDIVQRVASSASGGPSLASLNSDRDQFGNVFNGGPSAFASVLDDYNRIVREFVIFPNDSQNLGQPGKLVVKKLVSRFSENSDIIGIIGCSNGPTSLEIGNQGLALGRANRIAEELIAAGISRDKVFDEGCWSPTTDAEGFPNRGVVIDLWRRAG